MHTARILLADDHAVVRSGIANAIADLPGVRVVGEVGDGPAVFAALAAQQPDCLLIDVTMPSFEPIGDVGRIRTLYPLLRILVVSAYDDDVYVQGLFGAGVNGYHLKDQPLSDLRLAVQHVLAGEHWVCEPLIEKLSRLRSGAPLTLTERQRELLICLVEGLDNGAIARRTNLSVKTVENHLTRLYRHLGVQSRLEAVSYVRQYPALVGRAAAVAGSSAQGGGAVGRLALLIVDDNTRYRTQLRRMIARAYPAAAIDEADSTNTAMQLTRGASFQLAFVDVVLGDEDGIECVRQLRRVAPATRCILFSAYPDREFHREGLQAGAVAFLDKKDVNVATLRELIDDVLPG